MARIISLSAARKARDRAKDRQQADENAVKFGRTAAQKRQESDMALRQQNTLDGARRDQPAAGPSKDTPCPPDR